MTAESAPLKRSGKDRALIGLGLLFSLIAIFGASAGAFAYRQSQKLVREELGLQGSLAGEPANWLLVGTDSREGIDETDENAGFILGSGADIEGRRTDTMMIVRVDPKLQTIDIISVPRDLWVDLGSSQGRINSAYQISSNGGSSAEAQTAGRRSLVSAIQTNLGVEINHYAEVDFVGFQNIVDSLGGVVINFPYQARDTKSGLDVMAGDQLLDGTQALAYARSRFYQEFIDGRWVGDPTSDLGRTERQRNFIVQVAKALAQKSTQANVFDTDRQISVVSENIVFSSSVSYTSLVDLARTYSGVGAENIRSHELPVYNDQVGNASVLRLQASQADDALAVFRGQSTLGGATIDVLNGSGVAGQASQAAARLESMNLSVGEIGDSPVLVPATELRYNPAYAAIAQNLQSMVAFPVVLLEDPTVAQITLITGSDFS